MRWRKTADELPNGSSYGQYLCYGENHYYTEKDRVLIKSEDKSSSVSLCMFFNDSDEPFQETEYTYPVDHFQYWIPIEEILDETLPFKPLPRHPSLILDE